MPSQTLKASALLNYQATLCQPTLGTSSLLTYSNWKKNKWEGILEFSRNLSMWILDNPTSQATHSGHVNKRRKGDKVLQTQVALLGPKKSFITLSKSNRLKSRPPFHQTRTTTSLIRGIWALLPITATGLWNSTAHTMTAHSTVRPARTIWIKTT